MATARTKHPLETNILQTVAYVSDQIGMSVSRSSFYRWQTFLALESPYTPESRRWVSDFARWVRAGSTRLEARHRLGKLYPRYHNMAKNKNVPVDAANPAQLRDSENRGAIAHSITQKTKHDLTQIANEITIAESDRARGVEAVAVRINRLLDPSALIADVMSAAYAMSGGGRVYQPIFDAPIIEEGFIKQISFEEEEGRVSVSDFLELAPGSDVAHPGQKQLAGVEAASSSAFSDFPVLGKSEEDKD